MIFTLWTWLSANVVVRTEDCLCWTELWELQMKSAGALKSEMWDARADST